MINNNNLLLQDLYQTLLKVLKAENPNNLEAAFISWICSEDKNLVTAVLPDSLSMLDYRQVAQLGFFCDMHPSLLSTHELQLKEGLYRVKGRAPSLMGAPAAFTKDVVALLGLAIGSKVIGGEFKSEIAGWMGGFIFDIAKKLSAWERCMAYAALYHMGSDLYKGISIDEEVAEIRIALGQTGVTDIVRDGDYQKVMPVLFKHVVQNTDFDVCRAALQLRALQFVGQAAQSLSLTNHTSTDLMYLLNRIPGSFRRWTWEDYAKTPKSTAQKWDVQNEYHVQNLLYCLLAPIFPDVEDEFYLEQIGQKNPRADIGIPSLQLIIEVKFLRRSVRFSDLVEEIAADNSLYFNPNSEYMAKYKTLIVFVWDDSRRTHEYDKFKSGVNSFSHVLGTVIIPRPGNMERNT